MEYLNIKIKLSFVEGLRSIVLDEVQQKLDAEELSDYAVFESDGELNSIYIQFPEEIENPLETLLKALDKVKSLKSVARAYLVQQDTVYNPIYISKHKFLVGELIEIILKANEGFGAKGVSKDISSKFKTFKIACAGADSKEVRSIAKYIEDTYKFIEQEDADLKVHIIKPAEVWEVGIQTTPRPLSMRDYKVRNMSGAMDPTVAYTMNSLCVISGSSQADETGTHTSEHAKPRTYLNAFSGSATLLIEAALEYPNLEKLVGFDNNKEHLSLAIQNIKKAGLIKRIQLKEADIHDKPDVGIFDVITADLPFGMSISKGENLAELYGAFLEYCQEKLSPSGKLAVYTSESDTFEKAIRGTAFHVEKEFKIKSMTNTGAYLETKIFVCGR